MIWYFHGLKRPTLKHQLSIEGVTLREKCTSFSKIPLNFLLLQTHLYQISMKNIFHFQRTNVKLLLNICIKSLIIFFLLFLWMQSGWFEFASKCNKSTKTILIGIHLDTFIKSLLSSKTLDMHCAQCWATHIGWKVSPQWRQWCRRCICALEESKFKIQRAWS